MGGFIEYTIEAGDSIPKIAIKLGVSQELVRQSIVNGNSGTTLMMIPGNVLLIETPPPVDFDTLDIEPATVDKVTQETEIVDDNYISEATINISVFKRLSDDLVHLMDHADVLYLKTQEAELLAMGAPANHLASYEWVSSTLGSDFQNIPYDEFSVLENLTSYSATASLGLPSETLQQVEIDGEHLEYKNYAFSLMKRLVDTGLDTASLPSEIQGLFDQYKVMGDIPRFQTADADIEYWIALDQIDYAVFAKALSDSGYFFLSNEIDIDSALLADVADAAFSYPQAVHQDANQEQILADMEQFLAQWELGRYDESLSIARLWSLIEKMKERPTILDISVTDIISGFQLFYQIMSNRYDTLVQMTEDMAELNTTPEEAEEQRLRETYIQYLSKYGDSDLLTNVDLESLSTAELKRIANELMASFLARGTPEMADISIQYGDEIGAFAGVQEAMNIAFIVGGFIPVVDIFVDLAETLIALKAGDIAGAAFIGITSVLPFDAIFARLSKLRRQASGVASQLIGASRRRALDAIDKLDNKLPQLKKLWDSLRKKLDDNVSKISEKGIDNPDANIPTGNGSSSNGNPSNNEPPNLPDPKSNRYTYDEEFEARAQILDEQGKPHEGRTAARFEQEYGVTLDTPRNREWITIGGKELPSGNRIGGTRINLTEVDYFDPTTGVTYDAVTLTSQANIDEYKASVQDHLERKTDIVIIIDVQEAIEIGRSNLVNEVYEFVDNKIVSLGPGISYKWIPPRK